MLQKFYPGNKNIQGHVGGALKPCHEAKTEIKEDPLIECEQYYIESEIDIRNTNEGFAASMMCEVRAVVGPLRDILQTPPVHSIPHTITEPLPFNLWQLHVQNLSFCLVKAGKN